MKPLNKKNSGEIGFKRADYGFKFEDTQFSIPLIRSGDTRGTVLCSWEVVPEGDSDLQIFQTTKGDLRYSQKLIRRYNWPRSKMIPVYLLIDPDVNLVPLSASANHRGVFP